MSTNIYPSELGTGSLNGAPTSIGREATEALTRKIRGKSPLDSFIVSGLSLSGVAGQLTVNIAAGVAIINGYYCEADNGSVTGLTNNRALVSPNFIYCALTFNGFGQVNGRSFSSNTTGTPPANGFCIGIVHTDATQAVEIVESVPVPSTVQGNFTGDGSTSNRLIFLGFTPKCVGIFGTHTCIDTGGGDVETQDTSFSFSGSGTFPAPNYPEITSWGFYVKHSANYGDPDSVLRYTYNKNGADYRYIAWP